MKRVKRQIVGWAKIARDLDWSLSLSGFVGISPPCDILLLSQDVSAHQQPQRYSIKVCASTYFERPYSKAESSRICTRDMMAALQEE